MLPLFFAFVCVWGGGDTFVDRNMSHTHKNTAIVIHSTVRFSMSYPASAVGSFPNKGALHSFIVMHSSVSHTNIFSSQPNTSILERERIPSLSLAL